LLAILVWIAQLHPTKINQEEHNAMRFTMLYNLQNNKAKMIKPITHHVALWTRQPIQGIPKEPWNVVVEDIIEPARKRPKFEYNQRG